MSERTVLILAIAVLALALLGGGATIWFLNSTLSEKEAERDKLAKDVRQDRDKKAKLPALTEEVEKMNADLKKGIESIPDMDIKEFDELAKKLDELRKMTRTFIPSAEFSTAARETTGTPTPMSMLKVRYDFTAKGGFFDLLRLMNLIETNKRFILVDDFSFAPGSDTKSASPQRELRIRISTFVRKPTGTLTEPTAAAAEPVESPKTTQPPQ